LNNNIDYIIFGDSLFALTLTYYIAKELDDNNVLLLMRDKAPFKQKRYYSPCIFLLPFDSNNFPLSKSVIHTSKNLLQEIEINYRAIEKKNLKLSLLFRRSEEKSYRDYLAYLDAVSVSYYLPEEQDFFEFYSFIRNPTNWRFIELITQAYFDIKSIWEAYFQELKEMDNVKIYNEENKIIGSLEQHARVIFVTNPTHPLFSGDNLLNDAFVFQFPVIEQFPSTCIVDVPLRSVIWRDFEGFLWAYSETAQLRKNKGKKNNSAFLRKIKNLIRVKELPVLDRFYYTSPQNFSVYWNGKKTYSIAIPDYLQLVLSPAISFGIASLYKEKRELTLKHILTKINAINNVG